MAWATTDQARQFWPDSASLSGSTVDTLLDVSTAQCRAYAPSLSAVKEATLTTGSNVAVATGGSVFTPADVGATVVADAGLATSAYITTVAVNGSTATLSRAAVADVASATLLIEQDVPDEFMLATVYQAREMYAAGQRDGDIIGIGDYAIRARPLTSTVKSLLRPQTQPPRVG